MRKGVRALFREICSVYPPAKLFMVVMDGLKSKNARQRAGEETNYDVLVQADLLKGLVHLLSL